MRLTIYNEDLKKFRWCSLPVTLMQGFTCWSECGYKLTAPLFHMADLDSTVGLFKPWPIKGIF